MTPALIGFVAILGAAVLAAAVYWQIGIAEGAYLGHRMVAWLYDRFASRYEAVKAFDPEWESETLEAPVMRHLANRFGAAEQETIRVLDVATGTGRFARAMLANPEFRGQVTGLDASNRMLDIARDKLALFKERVTLRVGDGQRLPYPDGSFDVVACIEALEFIPDPDAGLRELARVCRRGGQLVVTNRIGPDAWILPGRTLPTPALIERLRGLGFIELRAATWLIDYDLVFATKAR